MGPERRRASARRALPAALALLAAGAGCPAFFPPQDHRAEADPGREPAGELPERPAELLELAERVGVEGGSSAELALAVRALERVETLEGESVELAVKQARLVSHIAEPMSKSSKVVRWLDRGDLLARRILAAAPERVEGHYYRAVFLGLRAQLQEVGGLDLVPGIVESARRAVEIDQGYDDSGPLVALGMVLVKAPAWPQGVGDPEEGIEVLERAVEVSDYPLNRMMLAEALLQNGQKVAGCRELSRVLAAPKRGRWARTGERYRKRAELLARSSRCGAAERL